MVFKVTCNLRHSVILWLTTNLSKHIHMIRPHGAMKCSKVQVQLRWERWAMVITPDIAIATKCSFNLDVTKHKLTLILNWKPHGPVIINLHLRTKVVSVGWNSGLLHQMLIIWTVKDTTISPVLILHTTAHAEYWQQLGYMQHKQQVWLCGS